MLVYRATDTLPQTTGTPRQEWCFTMTSTTLAPMRHLHSRKAPLLAHKATT
eukprot:m.677459 g.677459  ORF g.677459 m.677459 type:complete len:51 (-) comp22796_c0_seq1:67-219(-)